MSRGFGDDQKTFFSEYMIILIPAQWMRDFNTKWMIMRDFDQRLTYNFISFIGGIIKCDKYKAQ